MSASDEREDEYVDKLIEDGNLPLVISADEAPVGSRSGNPRSLILELSGSHVSPKTIRNGEELSGIDRGLNEVGLSVAGSYQTDNYGTLSVSAEFRRGTGSDQFLTDTDRSVSGWITVSNYDFPLGDGWLADSTAGITNATIIPLARNQTRFFVPTSPILGASVSLERYKRFSAQSDPENIRPSAVYNLTVGEPGLVGGLKLRDFTGLSGLAFTGGGQVEVAPGWSAGAQAIGVRGTRDPYSVILRSSRDLEESARAVSGEAVLGSLGYTSRRFRLQANSIWSNLQSDTNEQPGEFDFAGERGKAFGAWVDASLRTGRSVHSAGVYYLGPNLTWGASPIVNNAYGGYYRLSTTTQRWRWFINVDAVDSVRAVGPGGIILNGDLRHQLNFTTAIGVNATFRVANGQSSSQALGYFDYSNSLGNTRAELGWSQGPDFDLYRVGWIQNWSLPAWFPPSSRVSTQLSLDHRVQNDGVIYLENQDGFGKTTSVAAAISASLDPTSGVAIDATLAYNSNASTPAGGVFGPIDDAGGILGTLASQDGEAFSASVNASVRLSSRWSLTASFVNTRSSIISRFGLPDPNASPIGGSSRTDSFRLVAGYLTLRYAISAGRPSGAFGIREFPIGGTGSLSGRVFLDGNANGVRDPAETGVQGIIVILDGIHAMRTDESGYYRFDNVADGKHKITVNADALPLPWMIVGNETDQSGGASGAFSREVDIGVRLSEVLDIAAVR